MNTVIFSSISDFPVPILPRTPAQPLLQVSGSLCLLQRRFKPNHFHSFLSCSVIREQESGGREGGKVQMKNQLPFNIFSFWGTAELYWIFSLSYFCQIRANFLITFGTRAMSNLITFLVKLYMKLKC